MSRVTLSLLCISVALSSCNSRKQETAKASTASPAKPAPKPPTLRHWEVKVAAGRRAQDAQVVIVNLEQKPAPRSVQVREQNGASVTAQVAPGILAFRMNPLKAGEQARYLVDEDLTPTKPDRPGCRRPRIARPSVWPWAAVRFSIT